MTTVEELIERGKAAWRRNQPFDQLYRDAYRYAMPQRNVIDQSADGQKKGIEVFDSTAVVETKRLVGNIVSKLFPPYQNWCRLRPGPAVPQELQEPVEKELEAATTRMFSIIHNNSNFNLSIGEVLFDSIAGTGVMLVQKGQEDYVVQYDPIPQNEVALEDGVAGRTDAIFRKHKLPAAKVTSFWPDAKVGTRLAQAAAEKPNDDVEVDECSYRETGFWTYAVIDATEKSYVVERRMARSPWIVHRWMKLPKEPKGRGPLLDVIADVKTLNKLTEFTLRNAALAITGVYTGVNDGVLDPDTARMTPGSIIPVARNQGHPSGASLAPLERSGDFNVASLEGEKLILAITKGLLGGGLPPMNSPVRSPTEIVQRAKELQEDVGAPFARLHAELIIPIVQSTLDILWDARLLGTTAPIKITGDLVKIVVTSPLAMLQNLDEIESLVRSVQITTNLFGPQIAMLAFNVENIPEWIGHRLGVPADLMRTKEQRSQMQQLVGQVLAQQQAQAAGAGGGAAEAAGQGLMGATMGSA